MFKTINNFINNKILIKENTNNKDEVTEILTKLDKFEKLVQEVSNYYNILQQTNKILRNLYILLDNIIYHSGGYIWAKDLNGKYIYCDKSFCEDFFRIFDNDLVCPVAGKTDLELLSEVKKKLGIRHTFGNICISTDEMTLKENKKIRFIECGYIDKECFILDIIKTPLICNKENVGVIGFGKRVFNQNMETIEKILLDRKIAKIIYNSKDGKIFRILEPEMLTFF